MKGIGTAFFITTSRCTRDCPFCFYSTGYIDHPIVEMDAARMLGELAEEREADVVVDATGHPSGLETAFKIVRPAGRIILKTTVAEPYSIDMAPVVINELSLIGSRCGRIDRALELLSAKKIDLLPMITAEYPIEKGLEAFEKAMDKNSLKVLVKISR